MKTKKEKFYNWLLKHKPYKRNDSLNHTLKKLQENIDFYIEEDYDDLEVNPDLVTWDGNNAQYFLDKFNQIGNKNKYQVYIIDACSKFLDEEEERSVYHILAKNVTEMRKIFNKNHEFEFIEEFYTKEPWGHFKKQVDELTRKDK